MDTVHFIKLQVYNVLFQYTYILFGLLV